MRKFRGHLYLEKVVKSVSLFCVLLFMDNSLWAQSEVTDEVDPPRGLYLALSSGQAYFLDSADRGRFKDGWIVGLKAGYDLFKYFSAEAHIKFSGHNTNVVGQSGIPNSFFAYQLGGTARGNYPVTRRITLFGDLGGGLWYTSPNARQVVGNQARPMGTFGLGVQYFLRIRGLAMGLDPSVSIVKDLSGPIAQLSGFFRYTF